jgi:hydroxymethylbilane synthase
MPATLPPGLEIGAVLPLADVRDVLVTRAGGGVESLTPGARVGSDSRRRGAQLLALRPDLRVESIRGNVDTRLRKVREGEYDAAVLAAAGLDRLGLQQPGWHVFSVEEMLPAVGQAVLAVECRAGDAEVAAQLAAIEDSDTRVAITAERAFLRRLGAGCRLPVAAYGEVEAASLRLRGMLSDGEGRLEKAEVSGSAGEADRLGADLADLLTARTGVRLTS